MHETLYTCVACGRQVTVRFYLCSDCEKIYGKRKDDWPKWLLISINNEAKERMREARGYYEICFSDLGWDTDGSSIATGAEVNESTLSYDPMSEIDEKIDAEITIKRLIKLLTPRQLEILQLRIDGLSDEEIAEELGITQPTVNEHRKHIKEIAERIGLEN